MKRLLLTLVLLLPFSSAAHAAALPGFHVQVVQGVRGFLTALTSDSQGTIYYSTKSGDILRLGAAERASGKATPIAHVPTEAIGNCGLIGLALRDDRTAIVHYTTPALTYDIISSIDLVTGVEQEIHRFACDKDVPSRGVSSEHHGGNMAIAPDGSIFLAIGDYGSGAIAPDPAWNGGKVWRIRPDGTVVQFARGFRNPFDLAWDAANQRVILTDNGDAVDDEIDVVAEGDDCGWPPAPETRPPGTVTRPPVYVFPVVVAPTGLAALDGRNRILQHGYLLGSYVAKAIFYILDLSLHPLPDPIPIIQNESDPIIDVIETADGSIFFASGFVIYQLTVPARGDCNGDGLVNAADFAALTGELAAGAHPTTKAHASWGCDANGDGMIDSSDLAALAGMVRGRAVRR